MTTRRHQHEARAQLRLVVLSERRMESAIRAELNRATFDASSRYPNWESFLPEHERRMFRILWAGSEAAALQSALRSRERHKTACPHLELKLETAAQRNARISKWAKKHAARKVVGVTKTTKQRIANAVARAIAADLSPRDITRSILEDTGGMSRSRAETIARTESQTAVQTGQHMDMEATAEELGLVFKKTWVATEDDNTRETHLEADGQTVKMDETFDVGEAELLYPGDPNGPPEEIINCRCAVVYDV